MARPRDEIMAIENIVLTLPDPKRGHASRGSTRLSQEAEGVRRKGGVLWFLWGGVGEKVSRCGTGWFE